MYPKNRATCHLCYFVNRKKQMFDTIAFVLCYSVAVFFLFSGQVSGAPIDISDSPLDSQLSPAQPNLMFGFDDSGSMDWETLTTNGLFQIGSSTYYYIFDNPGDDCYTSHYLTGENRLYWKSQFAGHNVMYYNPKITYTPWLGFPDANVDKPRSHPYYDDFPTIRPTPYSTNLPPDNYLELDATYTAVSDLVVDDEGPNGTSTFTTTGTWSESGSTPEYNLRSKWTGGSGNKAIFTPDIPQTDNYEVFVWWNCYYNRDENAQITIKYNGGSTTLNKDQRGSSPTPGICGDWISLGSYNFAAGTSGSVTIERHSGSTGSSTVADAVMFDRGGRATIKNAHYYTWNDTDNDGILDTGEDVYLVNINGAGTGTVTLEYYKYTDDGDDKVESGELALTTTPPAGVVPVDLTSSITPKPDRTPAQELQNFANWYSFYRKRRATAVGAITQMIPKLRGVKVGIRSINGHIIQPVLSVDVPGNVDTLLNDLFSYHQKAQSTGNTPLRKGLREIGKYYNRAETSSSSSLSVSPLDTTSKGECQQNFTILFTDGYYNMYSAGVGNADSGQPAPYGDTAYETLADVAWYYWEKDLALSVDDKVPTNFYDSATWQHMVTYTVAFGLEGTLQKDQYDLYNIDPSLRKYPTWPSPLTKNTPKTIDDLWHTAVNGRGKYLSASNPEKLNKAFEDVINDVISRIGSGASVSINGEELHAGSVIYQSNFTTDWTGDVVAYDLDPVSGAPILVPLKWSAREKLDAAQSANPTHWNTDRLIASYNGVDDGIKFRYAELSISQKAFIDAGMLNYLRGDHSNEELNGGSYRDRLDWISGMVPPPSTLLADIVHSAPVYYNDVIYAGGNDGMLHAFDAELGTELFAYIPSFVFNNLPFLTQPAYTHKFYVELTPVVGDIGTVATPQHLLIGGLGKGGKGYYCLDVTDLNESDTDPLSITTEDELADKVQWEYPNISTPPTDIADMGYSFSRPALIRSNDPTLGSLVVFGNGYNSTNENAVLFILDAATGQLKKKIETSITCSTTPCSNGLSSPAVVDVNTDMIVDYVYAGDLQGNIWKFDLTATHYNNWDVAFDDGTNPQPLFQAKDSSGYIQPITTKPDVMYHCEKDGYMVIFGTGKYLGASDLAATGTQTVYGIWDYGDDTDNTEYLGTFDRGASIELTNQPASVTLIEQTTMTIPPSTSVFGKTLRVLSANQLDWSTVPDSTSTEKPNPSANAGWYFDLPDIGERVTQDLMIWDNKVIVTSSIPQTNTPCSAGGQSWLMEMDACTGGRLTAPQLDINDDNTIDDAKDLIDIGLTDPVTGDPILVAPTGIWYPTMLYPPVILNVPGTTELKFFSTAAGNIVTVREKNIGARRYWREIN